MSLETYFAQNLLIRVQPGFLSFILRRNRNTELGEAKVSCRQVSSIVAKLFLEVKLPEFSIRISGDAFLHKNKIVFATGLEEQISPNEFDLLVQTLMTCVPHMLLTDLASLRCVSALKSFVIYLVEKLRPEEGEECVANLKLGEPDKKLLDFLGTEDSRNIIGCFLYHHCDVVKSTWQLRVILKKTQQPTQTAAIVLLTPPIDGKTPVKKAKVSSEFRPENVICCPSVEASQFTLDLADLLLQVRVRVSTGGERRRQPSKLVLPPRCRSCCRCCCLSCCCSSCCLSCCCRCLITTYFRSRSICFVAIISNGYPHMRDAIFIGGVTTYLTMQCCFCTDATAAASGCCSGCRCKFQEKARN
jgi:hypothetical protein